MCCFGCFVLLSYKTLTGLCYNMLFENGWYYDRGYDMIFNRLLDLVYPQRCPFCGRMVQMNPCEICKQGLEDDWNTSSFQTEYCNWYSAPLYYTEKVRRAILHFKYHNRMGYSSGFVTLALNSLPDIPFDLICSVPEYKKEAREYSTSALLAKELSKRCQTPYHPKALKKIKQTRKQHEISYVERLTNLDGSFFANERIVYGKNILLCDDIITTGSTVNEIAKECKKAGAKDVYAIAIALSTYYRKFGK